jgi:SH3-like domain-containing protein
MTSASLSTASPSFHPASLLGTDTFRLGNMWAGRLRATLHCMALTLILVPSALVGFAPSDASAQAAASTFGSLKTDKVEARTDASPDAPVIVIFQKAGLPVAVLNRKPGWLQLQDSEGTVGWVREHLFSQRRTGLAASHRIEDLGKPIPVRGSDRETAAPVALLEAGVIVGVLTCDGRMCRINANGLGGFVDQRQIWGVGDGEIVR